MAVKPAYVVGGGIAALLAYLLVRQGSAQQPAATTAVPGYSTPPWLSSGGSSGGDSGGFSSGSGNAADTSATGDPLGASAQASFTGIAATPASAFAYSPSAAAPVMLQPSAATAPTAANIAAGGPVAFGGGGVLASGGSLAPAGPGARFF